MSDTGQGDATQGQVAKRPKLAVGIDFVEVDDVQAAVARFGDRYLRRVFTAHELSCSSREGHVQARHLAARFAAKEAAMKALRPSERLPAWRSIEVRQEESGRYTLALSDHAAELQRRTCLNEFTVSLSLKGNLAAAVVLALGRSDP